MNTMLTILKERLLITDTKRDHLLLDLLSEAADYLLLYTNRQTLPVGMESIVVRLAVISFNRLGIEGQTTHNEGGLSFAMEAIPSDIKRVMDRFRVARCIE